MKARTASAPSSTRKSRVILRANLDGIDDRDRLWGAPRGDDDVCVAASELVRDTIVDALEHALTAKQREVVEMHFFDGLSQCEIARRLGVTQQIVQKRLHGTPRKGRVVGGALRRLRTVLAPLAGPRNR